MLPMAAATFGGFTQPGQPLLPCCLAACRPPTAAGLAPSSSTAALAARAWWPAAPRVSTWQVRAGGRLLHCMFDKSEGAAPRTLVGHATTHEL